MKQRDNSKSWNSMKEGDIEKIWAKHCRKCKYRGVLGGHNCCDYIIQTGHSRGCRPDECTKYKSGERMKVMVRPKVNDKSNRKRMQYKKNSAYIQPALTYFGAMIDTYLSREDIKQRNFADRCGVRPECVSDWRRGKSRPKTENLVKVCKVLGMELTEAERLLDKGML